MKKLIGMAIGPALGIACRMVDDVVPCEVLHGFLHERLSVASEVWQAVDGESFRDWCLARQAATRAGVLKPAGATVAEPDVEDVPTLDACRSWVDSVPDGKVVTRKRMVRGTGVWLDQIATHYADEFEAFLGRSFTSLLRSVEIRRQESLREVEPAVTVEEVWQERSDVAIAFSRRARRDGDLRYLNAALKLGDWSLAHHRGLSPQSSLARYLLALAEQELSVKVLMS